MENTKGYGMEENLYDAITGGPEAAEKFFKGEILNNFLSWCSFYFDEFKKIKYNNTNFIYKILKKI